MVCLGALSPGGADCQMKFSGNDLGGRRDRSTVT